MEALTGLEMVDQLRASKCYDYSYVHLCTLFDSLKFSNRLV